jgi:uncharacterized protein YydD (DUF2326 family)
LVRPGLKTCSINGTLNKARSANQSTASIRKKDATAFVKEMTLEDIAILKDEIDRLEGSINTLRKQVSDLSADWKKKKYDASIKELKIEWRKCKSDDISEDIRHQKKKRWEDFFSMTNSKRMLKDIKCSLFLKRNVSSFRIRIVAYALTVVLDYYLLIN